MLALSCVSSPGGQTGGRSRPDYLRRGRRSFDRDRSLEVSQTVVKKAIQSAVQSCQFCVTVADPRGDDFPLIAVSEAFETMTGFKRRGEVALEARNVQGSRSSARTAAS